MASISSRQRLLLHLLTKRSSLASKASQGFTLIELLVVIVILGVLGAVGYGAYINQLTTANQNTARVAATAAAKSCAALVVIGDPLTNFEPGVDGVNVILSPVTCVAGATAYTATAGIGTNSRTASAAINAQGAVTPAVTPAGA